MRRDHPLWQAIIDLPHGRNMRARLFLAADHGDLSRVRELCDWHADVRSRDAGGLTALHVASAGHEDCARELVGRGANVNAATSIGFTPLMWTTLSGRVDTVRLLLAAGADKRRVDMFGRTARDIAVDCDLTGIAALLVASP